MATTDPDWSLELGGQRGPGLDARADARPPSSPEIWLDGDVLACACPDCGAPMSIRLWLMLADCFRCGASIELTQEQEQEALRLLEQRGQSRQEQARQAGSAVTPTMLSRPLPGARPRGESEPRSAPTGQPMPGAKPTPQVKPSPPQPGPEGRSETGATPGPPAAGGPKFPPPPPVLMPRGHRPLAPTETLRPSAPPIGHLYENGRSRQWGRSLSQHLPAWLVSLVLHLVAVLLLGMWIPQPRNDLASISLSTMISDDDLSGDLGEWEAPLDALGLDQPGLLEVDIPAELALPGQAEVELLGEAAALSEPAGTLAEFKDLIVSARPTLRGGMFAGRDPRLRREMLRREGGTDATEAAVARGLKWLAQHQNTDGSWSLHAFHRVPGCDGSCSAPGQASDAAGTALGLLPFLGAGQTHWDGDYQYVVRKGLNWLLEHQRNDGDLRDQGGFGQMYAHGQAAIVLCEAYAMTGDEQLRTPAQKALDFIVKGQHSHGGWRYQPGQAGDTSVFGWQLMAIQSGRMHYLRVPKRTLYLASRFLDEVRADRTGGLYSYQPGLPHTPPMTAEALLCRLYLGWPTDHPGIQAGVDSLLKNLPDQRRPNVYYWYYATQVLHHVGGDAWPKWNARTRTVLLDMQETRGHAAGSWPPHQDPWGRAGRLYMTSLAICTLEVYYRHMPLNRAEAVEVVDRLGGLDEIE